MPTRYICIHGHFYQPPRENPWLEAIEQQDSARPYHDWNQRVAAECYAPNATARILDAGGRIASIASNYARISFNFGPTLLSWMERYEPETYLAILEADRESVARFNGHGSAMAQAYNHLIMPLASERDKATQVRWGIEDFRYRFGRDPEGMWLPETAADIPTLEALTAHGIKFTVLAPHQAKRVRPLSPLPPSGGELGRGGRGEGWQDTLNGQNLDLTMPYRINLPSGRTIAVYFYDDPVSRAIAFEGLLRDGAELAKRLLAAFPNSREAPQLVHIATDGETYGHHHRYGDMALAYALHTIEVGAEVRLTNYGEFLELHPPTHEAEIVENTSWSCAHGIERWRSDCGCNMGHAGWNQAWRAPLRAALDRLRDEIAPLFEAAGAPLLRDPWAARDAYISVVLDRSPENVRRFLEQHAVRELSDAETVHVLKLMEMQRHAQLMYTSCGWFFDDISGIETTQVIQYAARALQLAQEIAAPRSSDPLSLLGGGLGREPAIDPLSLYGRGLGRGPGDAWGAALEQDFLTLLEAAKSNNPDPANGRTIYETVARAGLPEVAAHYAVSSLFEDYPDESPHFCYVARRESLERFEAGETRLLVGKVHVASSITRESDLLTFGVLHLGGLSISCGVAPSGGHASAEFQVSGGPADSQLETRNPELEYAELLQEASDAFTRADFAEVIRIFDRRFGKSTYSLRTLFRDQQRKVLNEVLRTSVEEAEGLYRQLYQHHAATLRFLSSLGVPAPRGLATAAEFVLNRDLRRATAQEPPDLERAYDLLDEARAAGTSIDTPALRFVLQGTVDRETQGVARTPWDTARLQVLGLLLPFAAKAAAEVDLWRAQNACYALRESRWPDQQDRAARGDPEATAWCEAFATLAAHLNLRL